MLEDKNKLKELVDYLINFFNKEKDFEISNLLKKSQICRVEIGSHIGIQTKGSYKLYLIVPKNEYAKLQTEVSVIKSKIKERISVALNKNENGFFKGFEVFQKQVFELYYDRNGKSFSPEEFIWEIKCLMETLKKVAQIEGDACKQIDELKILNVEYKACYEKVNQTFEKNLLENPNRYNSIWDWRSKWRKSELKKDIEKIVDIDEFFAELLCSLK